MEIIKISPDNGFASEYEKLIKTTWPRDFKEDFNGEKFSDKTGIHECDILIAQENGVFLGGAIISKDIFINQFSTKKKIKYKKYLQENGYKALVYLIINPNYRGKKIGFKILNYILNNYEKIWLSYEPGTILFYEKGGFKHYLDPISNDITGIMINQ
ncbi:GNAT family N-acetyltransferase [Candidatus Gracilibacteria bacterium]|nr:GNAT family N-acetyltransferase [Candidatus Gracilibacteria bacterium]